jgi:hypothetical protein
MMNVEGGDGSTLSLDFTTGVLDPRLTFTRSTTATYINSQGYVATMSAAPTNDPTKARFDYDPTTLTLRGLLIEGSTNNLLNWSESFTTSGGTNNNWADSSITRTTGQTDPANGTTAIRFTASAGNATVISSAAIGTSAQRTFSVWLRRVTGTGNIQYTTDNGTTWTTQAITSSWVRYVFAATTAAQRVGFRIVTSADAVEIWGAQLESGSGASSYIPTGASQGNRAQDFVTMSDISSLGFDTYQGTFVIRGFQYKQSTVGAYSRTLRFNGSTEPMGMPVDGVTFFGTSRNTGDSVIAENTRTNALFQDYAFGFSLNANSTTAAMVVSRNGSSAVSSRTNTGPTSAATSLQFNSNSADTAYASMAIKSVKFWPIAKSLAEMNALTTG